jgi:hypothetical protein
MSSALAVEGSDRDYSMRPFVRAFRRFHADALSGGLYSVAASKS